MMSLEMETQAGAGYLNKLFLANTLEIKNSTILKFNNMVLQIILLVIGGIVAWLAFSTGTIS